LLLSTITGEIQMTINRAMRLEFSLIETSLMPYRNALSIGLVQSYRHTFLRDYRHNGLAIDFLVYYRPSLVASE